MVWSQLLIDWAHLVLLSVPLGFLMFEVGVLSLGHAGAALAGGYAFAFVATGALSVPIGALVLIGFGVIVGLVALRVRGDVFAVVAFALAEVARLMTLGLSEHTGGALGLGPIERPDWMASDKGSLLAAASCVALVSTSYALLATGRRGLILGAARDNELVARSVGIRTRSIYFLAVLGSIIAAGLTGVLQVTYYGLATPDLGTVDVALQGIAAMLLGMWAWKQDRPLPTLVALLMGAFIMVLLPALLRWALADQADLAVLRKLLFGVVLFALVHPRAPTGVRWGG